VLSHTVFSLEKNHLSFLTFINDLEKAMECVQIADDTQLGSSQYAGGCSCRGVWI